MDILSENKPFKITLADGKEYTLPPMDLTTLANIEETLGSTANLQKEFTEKPNTAYRKMWWAFLRENYPDMTIEQAGRLATLEKLKDMAGIIAALTAMMK